MRKFSAYILALGALLIPSIVGAHEVYVLDSETVGEAMKMSSLPIFDIVADNMGQFFFWMFITVWGIVTVLSISLSKPLERMLDPMLDKLKRYGPLAARLTLGASMVASGAAGALFGPELPLSSFLSAAEIPFMQIFLIVSGIGIFFGFLTRLFSLCLMLVYIWMCARFGWYMITYTNYFGEMLMTMIAGNALYAADRYVHHLYPHFLHYAVTWMENHAFLILRVTFGISLMFASFYAKFLHAELALEVVAQYNLTAFFPFDPPFLVLGAFALEMLLGVFFLLGIEIRFASLFLLFWLSLSLLYFGESVWPHIVLAGTAIAIFLRGYDRHTLEWGLMHRHGKRPREPVL